MDIVLFTRNRLKQLRLSPRDRAHASSMTESYIADLLEPNGLQTASTRTHVHNQLERVLQLPHGQLAKLADLQRRGNTSKIGWNTHLVHYCIDGWDLILFHLNQTIHAMYKDYLGKSADGSVFFAAGSQGGQSISYPFPASGGPAPSSCSFPFTTTDRPELSFCQCPGHFPQ